MIVHIDMDGVLCDYAASKRIMKRIAPALRSPQAHRDFWVSLAPIKGAIRAVNYLRRVHDVYILSGPSTRNPGSYSGKRVWVEDHFDKEMCERLILCNYKGLMKGDVLIDDNVRGKGQDKFEGKLIHFGSKEYPNWDAVLEALL